MFVLHNTLKSYDTFKSNAWKSKVSAATQLYGPMLG